MKRHTIIMVCVVILSGSLFAQGFSISKPNAVGGNLVGMTQDKASYPSGTPIKDGLVIGPGIEFFLKYDVAPKLYFTIGTGFNIINHNMQFVDVARTTLVPTFELKAAFKPLPQNSFSPFLLAGFHAFGHTTSYKSDFGDGSTDRYYDGAIMVGGGADIAINEKVTFQASGDMRFVVTSDADPQPQFWAAKAGISYNLRGRSSGQDMKMKDELEYPLGDDELASLDDLFKDSGSSSSGGGLDDLDLLFAPSEQASGSMTESSSDNPDDLLFGDSGSSDVAYSEPAGQLDSRIRELKQKMDAGFQQLQNLDRQVRENERVIAGLTGDVAGAYAGVGTGEKLSDQQFKSKYEGVLQKVNVRNYKEAIPEFMDLIARNPDHKLASNCQYWIGECYNALGDYSKAIQSFNRVMEYRSSYKFDDALIMTGVCSMKMGDNDNAKQKFQELVNRYPDSEYAPKAMRYLGRL